uniref:polynucleotide adenylyltransferase n=1 Tax=Meloidogyne javanica TaxID=6303 RepID=A0A915LET3_MELJA
MIEFKMYGIDVDLIYAQIPFEKIETDFDIMDNEIIQWNKDKRSILALAGVRCLKNIINISPNQGLLVMLMRYVKLWAKNRLIYSNKAGYLSGHSLAIMSAKICIEYAQATSLSFLIKQFFNVYKAWKWEAYPLMLVKLVDDNEEFENASKIVEPWSGTGSSQQRGTKNEGNDGTQMSIITPGFPEQNTTFNVNEFTLKRIVIELKRGSTLIERYSHQGATKIWDVLIKELDWKTHYNYFILILCRAGEFETGYCNRQRVLIRTYLYNWEKENEQYNLIRASHLIPNYEGNVTCLNSTKL